MDKEKRLRQNIEYQLDRLLLQLKDLELLKSELDEEEYIELKQETNEQLREFEQTLSSMNEGSINLLSDIQRMKIAIQKIIAEAFQTPAVIAMFASKQTGPLRERLAMIERDQKLGKIQQMQALQLKKEILTALDGLGDKLSQEEIDFMNQSGVQMKKTGKLDRVDVEKTGIKNVVESELEKHN